MCYNYYVKHKVVCEANIFLCSSYFLLPLDIIGGLMIKKGLKKALLIGLCVAMLSGNASIIYAYTNANSNAVSNNEAIFSTIAPVNDLEEKMQLVEPVELSYQATKTGCNIQFNKINSYSVYQQSINQTFTKSDMKNLNKVHFFGELVDGYMFLAGKTLGNQIEITNLTPATNYTIYVYKNQEPIPSSLITELTFNTLPEDIKVKESGITSDSIKIKWNKAENAKKYEIYRNDKLINTVRKNEYTDKKLKPSTVYKYRVKAVYDNVEINASSQESKTIKVTTAAPVTVSSEVGTFKIRKGVESGSMGLPAVSGQCKTWANYQAVTMRSSPQYKLLNSKNCYTDPETGIRMVDDCYCVALGSYYGSTIGQKYLIKLSSGNEFKAILCDQKANRHTDANHQYAVNNKDIIEFYIDRRYKPSKVDGSYGSLPQFSGSVVSIKKIAQ